MNVRKKWFLILTVMTGIFLLGACGDKKEAGQSMGDNPRNHTAEDFMPISKGLEKHSLWMRMSSNPDRNSSVREIYVFKNGHVSNYSNFEGIPVEEIMDLTDKEIIKRVEQLPANKVEGSYKLDITLDRLGQNTETIEVIVDEGTTTNVLDLQTIIWENTDTTDQEAAYLAELKKEVKKDKNREIEGDYLIQTSEIQEDNAVFTFGHGSVAQTIFDTTFSGLMRYDADDSLFTRVDDSFVGFRLDDPDTKSKNITIEGK